MRLLEKLLALGHDAAMSEHLSRKVRISNALALVGMIIAAGSFPFDLITAPSGILVTDVIGVVVFPGCLLLNARGRFTVSRVVMLVCANLVIGYSTFVLGEASRQATVFFALASLPFFAFGLDEPLWLVAFVGLPVASYFMCQGLSPGAAPAHSIAAYRVYAPLVAFGGLSAANIAAARTHRRAEEALDDARARAVASARLAALGEMASGIAHEIRNPLAAISLASEQLAECKRIEDVPKLAAQTKRITGRITKIIDGLSSFARDASADPFVTVAVDQIVADTLELCRRRFAAHRVELKVPAIAPELVVECRPVQISQVLVNLLNNAHDAARAGTEHWVQLELETEAAQLVISVTDSGPGIPVELRERIFEPFFTTKGPDRGTGLGLSVSRGLVEAHHGTLALDARSSHTRFVLRLPLHQPRAA